MYTLICATDDEIFIMIGIPTERAAFELGDKWSVKRNGDPNWYVVDSGPVIIKAYEI